MAFVHRLDLLLHDFVLLVLENLVGGEVRLHYAPSGGRQGNAATTCSGTGFKR